jgi:GPH family glycoside/pentoside/hexuronide:cation symporter
MSDKADTVSMKEKIGYGFGDAASNLFFKTFMMYLLFFYTDVFGLTAAAVGTMFFVTRWMDALIEPAIGAAADRTKTRWGKFRPYLLWFSVPYAVMGVLTFSTPDFSPTGKLVWAYLTYTVMMIVYSLINIPYSALMGVMTSNSVERTGLASARFAGAFAAGMFVPPTLRRLVEWLGNGNKATGWMLAMSVYAVLAVALFLGTFVTSRERVQPPPRHKTSLGSDVKDLVQNRPWVVLFLVGLAMLSYVAVRNSTITYYFKYYVHASDATCDWYLFVVGLANVVGVLLTQWVTRLVGKRRLFILIMAASSALTLAYYLLRPENIALMFTLEILINLIMGPASPLIWAMYADTADYSEWKTGRRATGLVFSAASFAQKMGWTVGGALSGWLLAYFGYKANVAQNASALEGIRLMMSLLPAIGSVLATVFMLLYNLDDALVKRIEGELAERRRAEQEAPAPAAA